MVEDRLEGVEMFRVSEENEVVEGVDGDGGVSETVKKETGLLSEADVIVADLLEGIVDKVDSLDDLVAMGLESESVVKGVTEVGELGDFEKGEGVRTGREVPGEDPRLCRMSAG